MGRKSTLIELNNNHCKSVLDHIDITTKSNTHRKCVSCGKKFLLNFSYNTIYKHCIKHQELRKIIKSNIPGLCYEKYIRSADDNVGDLNETLSSTLRNDITNMNVNNKTEDKGTKEVYVIEKMNEFCDYQENSTFNSKIINQNDSITKEKECNGEYFGREEKMLPKNCLEKEEIITNSVVVDKNDTENISHDKSFNEIKCTNILKEDNFTNPVPISETMSNDSCLKYSNSFYRSLTFFKRTNEYGITIPISNTQYKCVSCEYIYPYKIFLIDIYVHAVEHNDLVPILKKKLKPSFYKVVLKKRERLKKNEVPKKNFKVLESKNDNESTHGSVSPSTSTNSNKKKQITNQPCLAVIKKLRQKPFETDVIKLTYIENGHRICNECKKVFTLNDRPYVIYKHCFYHKNFHKILIDNLQHDVLLTMLKKAKREEKVQNNKKLPHS